MQIFIVWLIVIGGICYSEWKKAQKKKLGGSTARLNGQRVQSRGYTRAQNAGGANRQVQQNQSYRPGNPEFTRMQEQSRAAMARKQQELKNRLLQRYGTASSSRGQASRSVGGQNIQPSRVQRTDDILSRATANVRENEANQLVSEMNESAMQGRMMRDVRMLANAIDINEESALMRQVNDLIVMGYQADLTFSRDFVAEGVEMLNSYEL